MPEDDEKGTLRNAHNVIPVMHADDVIMSGGRLPAHPLSANLDRLSRGPMSLSSPAVYKKMLSTLKSKANNRTIILTSLDSGYVDLGINLYESSFRRLGINNFLFVCSDDDCVHKLRVHNITAARGLSDKDSEFPSSYGSRAFVRKTHLKTDIALNVLRQGYTVLLVDADIVMIKNPFDYLMCKSCDLQIQSDGSEMNSGFYLARPTAATIMLHQKALWLGATNKALSNQKALQLALEQMRRTRSIKVLLLDDTRFPRGNVFFDMGHRMFATDPPCKQCVIIHNNWIVSVAAKRYRFKEFRLWYVDSNTYYSNKYRKYLYYENPIDFGPASTIKKEMEALKSALSIGYLLNRTVILPSFHCYGCKFEICNNSAGYCSLNSHLLIETFDRYFRTDYREHVFLINSQVPDVIRRSTSEVLLINNLSVRNYTECKLFKAIRPTKTFSPTNITSGATVEDIQRWFQPYANTSVLLFNSLYSSFAGFPDDIQYTDIRHKLEKGFKASDYRQFKWNIFYAR